MGRWFRNRPNPASRKGGRQGCLCKDGTYSRKCCDGSIWAQGIGDITGTLPDGVSYFNVYRCRPCAGGNDKNFYINNASLTVGEVYYLDVANNQDGCYTILNKAGSKGVLINSATLYDNCADCISSN